MKVLEVWIWASQVKVLPDSGVICFLCVGRLCSLSSRDGRAEGLWNNTGLHLVNQALLLQQTYALFFFSRSHARIQAGVFLWYRCFSARYAGRSCGFLSVLERMLVEGQDLLLWGSQNRFSGYFYSCCSLNYRTWINVPFGINITNVGSNWRWNWQIYLSSHFTE